MRAALGVICAIGQYALGFVAFGINGALGYYSVYFTDSEATFTQNIRYIYTQIKERPTPLVIWLLIAIIIILLLKEYYYRTKSTKNRS